MCGVEHLQNISLSHDTFCVLKQGKKEKKSLVYSPLWSNLDVLWKKKQKKLVERQRV
jgi:hypothetical protein